MSQSLLSVPALSWDTIVNMKKAELELISDADIYLFFEKGMGGKVSYISKRYSQASNKYLKSYDPKQESKQILCLNANTYTVMQCLNFFQQVDSNGSILKNLS